MVGRIGGYPFRLVLRRFRRRSRLLLSISGEQFFDISLVALVVGPETATIATAYLHDVLVVCHKLFCGSGHRLRNVPARREQLLILIRPSAG